MKPHSLLIAGLLATLTVPAFAETRTWRGELVDPAAYLQTGHRGPEQEEATYEAVDGGQTLALLEEGTSTLYLLLAEEPGEDPNELAYDYVNRTVTVTGALYERGGLRGLVATSIAPIEPAETASAPPTDSN